MEHSKTTLKEKKDIVKKQSQQSYKEKIKYVIEAFDIFATMREIQGIHPDAHTLASLLRILKLLYSS